MGVWRLAGSGLKVLTTAISALMMIALVPSSASAATVNNPLWSGHVTTTGDVSHVAGSWQVPRLSCAVGENSGASQWIGLDGVNAGLVQVGVATKCAAGLQVNLAFYQVLPQNSTAQYLSPTTNVVWNGDIVDAEIRRVADGQYSISLSDGWWKFSQTVTYNGSPKTAEWIVESGDQNGGVNALSNFGTVHFESALFNDKLVTNQDTNKFVATGSGDSPKTEIADIGQYGGHGPNFDVKWLRQ